MYSKSDFIYLTSTLLSTPDGKWRIQQSIDRQTKKPIWVITRKESGERFKRVTTANSLDDVPGLIEEYADD